MHQAKRALICGVTGQDGAYLARFLCDAGYVVLGTSRAAATADRTRLHAVGVAERVELLTMRPEDPADVARAVAAAEADELYDLLGPSSVGRSFVEPRAAFQGIALGAFQLLEALRLSRRPTRLFLAGSSECFGEDAGVPAHEGTPFRPQSPYAAAKAAAHAAVAAYRASYGLYACTGILFSHESPLRPEGFVTRKVVRAACRIAAGNPERLRLGNLSARRDWGWAPEYVPAMWRMLQQPEPEDLVLATGVSHSLEELVAAVFAALDLDWREHVEHDPSCLRPRDVALSRGNPARAAERLGWRAERRMPQVAAALVAAERERLARHG